MTLHVGGLWNDRLTLALGFGVNVMCVAPGAIRSNIGASVDKKTFLKSGTAFELVEQRELKLKRALRRLRLRPR